MAETEPGRDPEEEVPQEGGKEEYSLERSKNDLENDMKEMRDGKIDIKEFKRRREEAIKKLGELKGAAEKSKEESARDLKKAVNNFNRVINRKIK